MFEQNINRGAALLDVRVHDWVQHVDVNTLYLSSCYNCVVGQLYGDYEEGVEALGIVQHDEEDRGQVSYEQGIHYGFNCPTEHYDLLTTEWIRFILTRRGANEQAIAAALALREVDGHPF